MYTIEDLTRIARAVQVHQNMCDKFGDQIATMTVVANGGFPLGTVEFDGKHSCFLPMAESVSKSGLR